MNDATTLSPQKLGAKADALIARAESGIDSAELARRLRVQPWQVDKALEAAVAAHRYVTCRLIRDSQQLVLYRMSTGSTLPYSWRDQGLATWEGSRAGAVPRRADKPKPVPKPVPAPAPAADDTASEVLDAAAPPPAPAPVPLIGTVDIDAAHRGAAEAAGEREPGDFICALYSNGALLIRQRELLRYLDRLRGDELAEQALGVLR